MAMFVFPPRKSRREDSNGGSDSARALEIIIIDTIVNVFDLFALGQIFRS